jgi:hypothetical protein
LIDKIKNKKNIKKKKIIIFCEVMYNENTIFFSILLIRGVYYKFLRYRLQVTSFIVNGNFNKISYKIFTNSRENGGENDKACG